MALSAQEQWRQKMRKERRRRSAACSRSLQISLFIIVCICSVCQFRIQVMQGNLTDAKVASELQRYVLELTNYISENNAKYNRNLSTLKEFYEEQISQMQGCNEAQNDALLQQKGEIAQLKNALQNAKQQLSLRDEALLQEQADHQQQTQRLAKERLNVDEAHQQLNKLRQANADLQTSVAKLLQQGQQGTEQVIFSLKSKQMENAQLKKELVNAQDALAGRFSLPEKLQDVQLQLNTVTLQLQHSTAQTQMLQQKLQVALSELDAAKREIQTLKMAKATAAADTALRVEQAVGRCKEKSEGELRKVQQQLHTNYAQLRSVNSNNEQLEGEVGRMKEEVDKERGMLQRQKAKTAKAEKERDEYLEEFRRLKTEYEAVISKLEASMMQYQKINFMYEQENKDLNQQLLGMNDLLQQVKAINALQPVKAEYRKWAQLERIASKQASSQENNLKAAVAPAAEEGLGSQWDSLLRSIQNIQV